MDITPVILAGGHGDRLQPLTKRTPKALLAVANRPLIALPLGHLERCGFRSAVVVTVESQAAQLKQFLDEKHGGAILVDLVVVPDDAGTAVALLAAKPKVRGDVLVMSVDLITDVPLQKLADTHHLRGAAATVLLKERAAPREGKPPKWEEALVLDATKEQLLYMAAATDCDGHLALRNSLLLAHGHVAICTTLTDVHCYILARWVFDLLEQRLELSNLRYELLPFLLRHQYIRTRQPLPEARGRACAPARARVRHAAVTRARRAQRANRRAHAPIHYRAHLAACVLAHAATASVHSVRCRLPRPACPSTDSRLTPRRST